MRQALRNLVVAGMAVSLGGAAMAADVSVASAKVSKGFFRAENCEPETSPKIINECVCEADISKAQITGVPETIAGVINSQLSLVPEQLASESCAGKPTSAPESGLQVNKVTADYKVVYQTPKALSVLVTYTNFGAGAAHPTNGSEGYTFDLATGKTINPTEMLTPEQMKKANEFARAELMKKYGDSLFDETKDRTEPYLVDGNCEDCTLYYVKDGWNLRFALYAIAPYASGEPEITIPTSIIPDPETLLTAKKK